MRNNICTVLYTHTSMLPEQVNEIFLQHKAEVIKLMGRDATSDSNINKIGREFFKASWGGVMSEDMLTLSPKIKNKYFVLNTGNRRSAGIHWTACYAGSGSTIYVYDSFGRRSSLILKQLVKQAQQKHYKIVESNHDKEQHGYSAVCGQISLSWLLTVKTAGIKNALMV